VNGQGSSINSPDQKPCTVDAARFPALRAHGAERAGKIPVLPEMDGGFSKRHAKSSAPVATDLDLHLCPLGKIHTPAA